MSYNDLSEAVDDLLAREDARRHREMMDMSLAPRKEAEIRQLRDRVARLEADLAALKRRVP